MRRVGRKKVAGDILRSAATVRRQKGVTNRLSRRSSQYEVTVWQRNTKAMRKSQYRTSNSRGREHDAEEQNVNKGKSQNKKVTN